MTYHDPWIDYAGASRIWLAVGLLALAAGVVYAGSRLPLPIRAAQVSRKTRIVVLIAWVASIVALLTAVDIYIQHYVNNNQGAVQTPPPDHVAPVTFTAVVVLFIVIFVRSPRGSKSSLAGAVIGAIAAPFIFELPFDLIVMGRVHVSISPNPGGYVGLLFALLLLADITTLLLLRLSPMVRLTRATFYCFALMLGVFAIWALAGFGYPSAPVPLTLNIVSKLLAFATALTLFFPQQRPAIASTPDRAATSEPVTSPVSSPS